MSISDTVLRRIPRTADGAPVLPGDAVFHPNCVKPYAPLVVISGEDGTRGPEHDGWFVEVPTKLGRDGFVCQTIEANIDECFATTSALDEHMRIRGRLATTKGESHEQV